MKVFVSFFLLFLSLIASPKTYAINLFGDSVNAIGTVNNNIKAVIPPTQAFNTNVMNEAQQNIFWFFRMYSDIMMLSFVENNPSRYSTDFAQNFVNDLQFIHTQALAGNTGFDPALIQDLTDGIANPKSYSQYLVIGKIMFNYNGIISGLPPQPYDPNTSYDFMTLTPDDLYNYYLIQLGISIFNTVNSLPQNNFWDSPSGGVSLLGSLLGEFMCAYFVQRDGMGTSALQTDLSTLKILLTPIMDFVNENKSANPNLYTAIFGDQENKIIGLNISLNDLMKGQWDFGPNDPIPDQSNNTPPPAWDVNTNTKIKWTYGTYYPLLGDDSYLAEYIATLRTSLGK